MNAVNTPLEKLNNIGKKVFMREKAQDEPLFVGVIVQEVSVLMDAENRYCAQMIELDSSRSVVNDPTRYLFRVCYYTERSDGRLCLGSQMSPIMTPKEFWALTHAIAGATWPSERCDCNPAKSQA